VRLSWSCVLSVFADPSSVTLRAFGWLYEHHPRTAIANLSQLVAPVCVIKSQRTQLTHGYWKDLLNILALATVDQFDVYPAPFLHLPRGRYSSNRSVGPSKMTRAERRSNMTPEERDALLTAKNGKAQSHARELRVKSAADAHALLLSRLSDPRFRALYIAVARLFANELVGQTALMRKAEALPGGEERNQISREVSLGNNNSSPPPQRTTAQDYDYDVAAAATGTRSPCAPSHSRYTARVESAGSIAGSLRRSYGTCPGTGCTFSVCDSVPFFPFHTNNADTSSGCPALTAAAATASTPTPSTAAA
jgi:Domain of unknown function (DUF2828)